MFMYSQPVRCKHGCKPTRVMVHVTATNGLGKRSFAVGHWLSRICLVGLQPSVSESLITRCKSINFAPWTAPDGPTPVALAGPSSSEGQTVISLRCIAFDYCCTNSGVAKNSQWRGFTVEGVCVWAGSVTISTGEEFGNGAMHHCILSRKFSLLK